VRRLGVAAVTALLRTVLTRDEEEHWRQSLAQESVENDAGHDDAVAATLARNMVHAAIETPQSSMRAVLVTAAKRMKKSRQQISKALGLELTSRLWWKTRLGHGRVGRPNKVDDQKNILKVRAFLVANSSLTSYYRKIGGWKQGKYVQMHHLKRSRRKLWMNSREMQQLLGYAAWYKHLRKYHSEFRRFGRRTDVCPTCHKYDKIMIPRIRKTVGQTENTLDEVWPGYLDSFRAGWNTKCRSGLADPEGSLSFQYVSGLRKYLEAQNSYRSALKDPDDVDARRRRSRLREAEVQWLGELKALEADLEGCEHHFHSTERQHKERERMIENPIANEIDIQLDFMENGTLPVGPSEAQDWFWATSRLGYTTLGFFVNQCVDGKPKESYFHYVAMILDHTALFAYTALKDLLVRLSLRSGCVVHVWADCGPHFRAYQFLWGLCQICLEWKLNRICLHFCSEHHGKGRCDGQFGLQRRWLLEAAVEMVIATLEDLEVALTQGATETVKSDPTGPSYHIVHFKPQYPKEAFTMKPAEGFIESSYCLEVRQAPHAFHKVAIRDFTYSDRRSLVHNGRDVGSFEVLKAKLEENWRFSYRQTEPEKEPIPFETLRRRLSKQRHAKCARTSRRKQILQEVFQKEKRAARVRAKVARSAACRVAAVVEDNSSSGSGSDSSSSSSSCDKRTINSCD
jgi:hypothetical protein